MTKALYSLLCIIALTAFTTTSLHVNAGTNKASVIAEKQPDSKEKVNKGVEAPQDEESKSYQQFDYEMGLQHAVVSYGLLKDFWPLKFPKQALSKNQLFDKNASDILTSHLKTLLSINAPLYKVEIPELFTLWKEAFDLADEAEAKKLYSPPEDLRSLLTAWRAKKAIAAEIEASPWVQGPTQVSIDENLEPIFIPQGYRFLPAKEHTALNERINAIKNAAITKENIKLPHFVDDKRISTNWLMPTDNQNWSADIVLISKGHTAIDEPLPSSDDLIRQIRSRLDQISNLRMDDNGKYSEKAVRWLIKPTRDKQRASLRWAITNGMVTQPLGIIFAHLTLGATQQVLVSFNHLQATEYFATSEYLPEGRTPDDFKAENRLNAVTSNLAPLFESVNFIRGKRLEDAKETDLQNPTSLEYLITGAPSIMEAGVKRIIAEQKRKENFWYFLQDHPRYQWFVFTVILFLLFGIKNSVDNWMQQDGVWKRVLKQTLSLLSIIMLIVGAFLIWLNFNLK